MHKCTNNNNVPTECWILLTATLLACMFMVISERFRDSKNLL